MKLVYRLYWMVILAMVLGLSGCGKQVTPVITATPTAPVAQPTEAAGTPELAPPAASSYAHEQVIRFDADPVGVEVNGAVVSGQRDRYELEVLPGEILDVRLTSLEDNAVFSILGPDDAPLPGTEEGQDVTQWNVIVPAGGAYSIVVGPTRGNATYTLLVHTALLSYQPLHLDVCQSLQADLIKAFEFRFTLIDAPFTEPITGETGMACTLEANGTGADFGAVAEALDKVRGVLLGWEENPMYAADGPTGSVTAFNRDSALLLVVASWEPSADANCPADQPISACVLTPEQQLYSVRLQGVMK